MKKINLLILAIIVVGAAHVTVPSQTSSVKRLAPDALVADLYKEHNAKRSPFFQTRSRARVDKYFERDLGNLIWKDAVTSKNEVGAIDGDPLYDAQDMEIKNFAIGTPAYEKGLAQVPVTFENFGQQKKITFILVNGRTGWRIHDIDYGGDQGTMRGWFKKR